MAIERRRHVDGVRLLSGMAEGDRLRVMDAARRYEDECIVVALSLPRRAPSGLRGQFAEAAQAVSRILAEGFGSLTNAEKIHYSQMALADRKPRTRRGN